MFAYISDQLSQESSLTSYTSFVLDALRLSRSVYKVIVKVEVRVQLQRCCCCCALSLLSVKLDPQTAKTAQLRLSVCAYYSRSTNIAHKIIFHQDGKQL